MRGRGQSGREDRVGTRGCLKPCQNRQEKFFEGDREVEGPKPEESIDAHREEFS